MPRVRYLTVEEAVEMVTNDLDSVDGDVDVVTIPADDSDEDEGNDDGIGVAEVADVPGEVEVHFQTSDTEDGAPPPPPAKKRRNDYSAPVWRNAAPDYTDWQMPSNSPKEAKEKIIRDLGGSTAVETFEKLFTPELFHLIQLETLRYARDVKNDQLFSLSDQELKAFIGILLYSGYSPLPSERMYWSNDDDLSRPIVRQAMTRSEYLKIKSYLHVQDNNKQKESKDRGFKVRPLIEMINKSFQQYGIFESKLAIDEMIVRYYGHNSLKQFIRGKPIRFGYKLWAVCGSDGFCYKFDLYCGKEERAELRDQPLGTRVVLDMLSVVSDPSGHEVFFDNFFTSRTLLSRLKEQGIRATGTVRENRLDKCPVTPRKEMEKSRRGSYQQRFDRTSEVLLVRWHDNKIVNVMTNYDTADPPTSTTRYDRTVKKRIPIPQPKVLKNYNSGMGGVDLHDQMLGAYEVAIRGKKWYWCLITRMLDMAVVNSHILHKTATPGDQLTLLDFRREIATTYLRAAACEREAARLLPSNTPASLRYDGVGHMLAPLNARRRCQLEGCKLRSTKRCVKCDVAICFKCFALYHGRQM